MNTIFCTFWWHFPTFLSISILDVVPQLTWNRRGPLQHTSFPFSECIRNSFLFWKAFISAQTLPLITRHNHVNGSPAIVANTSMMCWIKTMHTIYFEANETCWTSQSVAHQFQLTCRLWYQLRSAHLTGHSNKHWFMIYPYIILFTSFQTGDSNEH